MIARLALGRAGAKLRREVPGLTYKIYRANYGLETALSVSYPCPCGTVFRHAVAVYSRAPKYQPNVIADMIKRKLREHVASDRLINRSITA
jgi:hypothetical protein